MTSRTRDFATLLVLIIATTSQIKDSFAQEADTSLVCEQELANGPDPHIKREHVDVATSWTFVADEGFKEYGQITAVNLFAGEANRGFAIGIYRPQDKPCKYQLVRTYRFDRSLIQKGHLKLIIPEDVKMGFLPGDHYGFVWFNKGVATFTNTDKSTYCEETGSLKVGQIKQLKTKYGAREYSVSVMYKSYNSPLAMGYGTMNLASAETSSLPSPYTYISPIGFDRHGIVSRVNLNAQLSLPTTKVELCTNKHKTLRCSGRQTLAIVSAYYAGVDDCTAEFNPETAQCQMEDAIVVVKELCQGRRTCIVKASTRNMGTLACAANTNALFLQVTYACQDVKAQNIIEPNAATVVENIDITKISSVNQPSGFTYIPLGEGEKCKGQLGEPLTTATTDKECGLACDLDPGCVGFNFNRNNDKCFLMPECQARLAVTDLMFGYKKAGDLILAAYTQLDHVTTTTADKGGVCHLQIQKAVLVRNVPFGNNEIRLPISSEMVVDQNVFMGVTSLTASLRRLRTTPLEQEQYPTYCERSDFPHRTWFDYTKGDGSYGYDLSVEYLTSSCTEQPGPSPYIPVTDGCTDELPEATCRAYKDAGNCKKLVEHFMAKKYCQRTCGMCSVATPACAAGQIYRPDSNICEGHCLDRFGYCKSMSAQKCSQRTNMMKCPVSCKVCPQSCSRGYKLKRGKCVDINECKENRDICPENARCINRNGYYECVCLSNFIYSQIYQSETQQGICKEITCRDRKGANYCNRRKNLCFDPKKQAVMVHQCKKTCGLCGINCDEEGHMINEEKQCVDINECEKKTLHKCGRDAVCQNTDGGYECVCTEDKPLGNPKKRCLARCEDGYQLQGTRCKRINPCTNGLHTCPADARCQVTKTSYRCRCPRGESDVIDQKTGKHKCIRELMCRASGDPHFYTFDGVKVDFMGVCVYSMVTTNCPQHIKPLPEELLHFTVDVKNHHRNGKTRVSYLQYLEVEIGGDSVRLDQKGVVFINTNRVHLPYLVEEAPYSVVHEGNNVVLRMKSGALRVVWSGSTAVNIYIDEEYSGHVCGLCGDGDGDKVNDMVTKEGEQVTSESELGNSWVVGHKGGDKCVIVVEDIPKCSEDKNRQFNHLCGRILVKPFDVCNEKVPTDKLIEECVFDLCAEFAGEVGSGLEQAMMGTVCDHYIHYADLCRDNSVYVDWNKEALCPHNPECPLHSIYSPSIFTSPSCADPEGISSFMDQPISGCQCEDGLLQDMDASLTCVQPERCGCTVEEQYHSVGEMWMNDDCTEKFKCIGLNVFESWLIDCHHEAAFCGSKVPVLNILTTHGCYCRHQPKDQAETCDESISDPVIVIIDDDDFDDLELMPILPPFRPHDPVIIVDPELPPIIDDMGDCQDKLPVDACEKYRDNGGCIGFMQYQESMMYCQRTCGLCNTPRPTCEPGFIFRPDTNLCEAHCQDKDTCATSLPEAECTKWYMKRNCPISCGVCLPSCSRGYKLEDGKCVDINECTENENICPETTRCANRKGFYKCICPRGFEVSEVINYETKEGACKEQLCADKRTNTTCTKKKDWCFNPKRQSKMIYICKEFCGLCQIDCDKAGYMINQEKQCVDINECEREDLHKCGRDAVCQNTDGGYECVCTEDKPLGNPKKRCLAKCDEGYQLVGTRCKRINPCITGEHTCPENVRCQLTKTSYRCRCTRGESDVIDEETGRHKCIKEFACIARGDPHYYTYDGEKIDYQGTCPHLLVGTLCPPHISPLPQGLPVFNILAQNHHRRNKTRVSFVKEITVHFGYDMIHLDQGGLVYINDIPTELPYQSTDPIHPYVIALEGENVIFSGSNNAFKVVWSTTTSVKVYISEIYYSHVCGICGNADKNITNDMVTAGGELVTSEVEVAESWKLPGCDEEPEPEPECTPEQNELFRERCSVINEPPFSNCHRVIDPELFIKGCVFDLCAAHKGQLEVTSLMFCIETLCDHYKSYADACLAEGILIPWNKEEMCPFNPACPENSAYVHIVPFSQSCADPENFITLDEPMGGCLCNPGYLQDGDFPMSCVPPHMCGCTDEENNYHSIGALWYNTDCSMKYKCVEHKTIQVWVILCDPEEAVCSSTVSPFDAHFSPGCYCSIQTDPGVLHRCDVTISGPREIIDDQNDDDYPFIIVDPFPIYPYGPIRPDLEPFDYIDFPYIPEEEPYWITDPDDMLFPHGYGTTIEDEPVATTYAVPPPPPLFPRRQFDDQPAPPNPPTNVLPIHPPKLNESEDNSYFQLEPEPTPQLKPRPLGMESCVITFDHLTANSELPGDEAYKARPLSCNSNDPPSGWTPEEEETEPYLQIDLGSTVPVHGLGTLGHYSKACWVEKYKVFVSEDGQHFEPLLDKNTGEERIFDGNQDQNTWRHHCFHRYYGEPILARFVRIVPLDQDICKSMRIELYGFRNSDDPQLLHALESDGWTRNTTGCQCYFDHTQMDCACCESGGCQCPDSNRHQCVQCGYSTNCGIPENNDDNNQEDPWTKTPSGCPCPEDPSDLGCACCQKHGCNCGSLQPNQCTECGHTEHCGEKPDIFGPPEVCIPKTCPEEEGDVNP